MVFKCGIKGVTRWYKAVDYILENRKGPILRKMLNIKLLDCNLNFGLKWAFVWRLVSFTEKHEL